ncbi:MAG: YHYH protein [Pontiellaceae bacterium]
MKWTIFLCVQFCITIFAEPLLSSWFMEGSSTYAELFASADDENNHNEVHTWDHGAGTQLIPTYSGVNEVSYSDNWVYIRTTGLGHHIMGPWYRNEADTQIFGNFPANIAAIYRFPRIPTSESLIYNITPGGAIGYFVDGVAMFDSRDAFSYINALGIDGTPNGNNGRGDSIWNRDAYENENITFDSANAHQASDTYHYHANPKALRFLLGGHVDYNSTSNTYSEKITSPTNHSPLIGWVADGYPIYGPYGYADATDTNSTIRRMISGYQVRDISNRTIYPAWANRMYNNPSLSLDEYGPDVNVQFPLGHYIEDYEFLGDIGFIQGEDFDLDEHNGRFCITPEFPQGTYAYFTTIEANGTPVYPYNIGRSYFGSPNGSSVNNIIEEYIVFAEGGAESAFHANLEADIDHCKITFDGAEGGHYRIDFSTNLTSGFTTLATNLTSSSHHFDFTDSNLFHQVGFYRVVIEAADQYDDDGYDSNVDMHSSDDSNDNLSNAYVSPSEEHAGQNFILTITLNNEDFGRAIPPLQNNQGVIIPVNSLLIESIGNSNISNINRISRFVTTCDVSIPNNTLEDTVDITISFLGPNGNTPTFILTDVFTIE